MSYSVKAVGRPAKYSYILRHLEEDQLYSPARVAYFARDNGLLQSTGEEAKKELQRIRAAMIRLSNARNFPDLGDGKIVDPGHPPCPSWFGWRWKSAYTPY